MMLRYIKFFVLIVACLGSANAVELIHKGQEHDGVVIRLSGRIKDGDGEKLGQSLGEAKRNGLRVSAIELDSPGGLVSAGATMARLVRDNKVNTVVNDGSACASACFMIFAAGKERITGEYARIGVHSAVNPLSGEDNGAKSATIDMTRFLAELNVPPTILGKLVVARPSDMYWLTKDEMREMQTNNEKAKPTKESYVEKVSPPAKPIPEKTKQEDLRKANDLFAKSLSYIRAGQSSEALPLLKQASEYSPYDPDIANNYGYALYLGGRTTEAKDAVLLALQIKTDFSDAYRVLALTASSLGDRILTKESLLKYYRHSNYKDNALDTIRRMASNKGANQVLQSIASEVAGSITKP